MPQLHETLMGRKLIEHTLPELAEQLKRVANALENKTPQTISPRNKEEIYEFLELEEALTVDPKTAQRIRAFLIQEGIWEKPNADYVK